MGRKNKLLKEQVRLFSLLKRMLLGAGIGLLLISIFLAGTGEPSPEWGRFWMIRPLIIVPMAGALGGLSNYLLVRYHNRTGLKRTAATFLSAVIFIIGLWLGFVLGLDGTLWD